MKLFYCILTVLWGLLGQNLTTLASQSESGLFSDEIRSPMLVPEYLDVDQAFALTVVENTNVLLIGWVIETGHYLYWKDIALMLDGEVVDMTAQMPKGTLMHDQYFGEVRALYGNLILELSIDNTKNHLLEVQYRGCAEAGLCYPLQRRLYTIEKGDVTVSATP